MRRAAVALLVTVVAVVWLVSYRTHPPRRPPPRPPALVRKAVPHPPGTRVGTGVAISTPNTTIQVRAFVHRGRLIDVQELIVSNDNAHTKAINDRAIPILHAEALRAGSAKVDVVSGATGTSASYMSSLQAAIDNARG
jgi:uncharacterized protein with FMN-binding domain